MGAPDADDAVCVVPDAPGWRATGARWLARRLSESGSVVCMPDVMRGDVCSDEAAAARDGDSFREWAAGHQLERVVSDILAVVSALRERGARRVSLVGLGWGAKAALAAAAREGTCDTTAAVCPEGTVPEDAIAAAAKAPLALLWAGSDDDNLALAGDVEGRLMEAADVGGAHRWVSRPFPDEPHGFAYAARGAGNDGAMDEGGYDEASPGAEEAAVMLLEWTSTASS